MSKRKRKLPPDPENMNNKRASWASQAIAAFCLQTGQRWKNTEEKTEVISDMLCDLWHYCDREGIDYERCLYNAGYHYTEETAE